MKTGKEVTKNLLDSREAIFMETQVCSSWDEVSGGKRSNSCLSSGDTLHCMQNLEEFSNEQL